MFHFFRNSENSCNSVCQSQLEELNGNRDGECSDKTESDSREDIKDELQLSSHQKEKETSERQSASNAVDQTSYPENQVGAAIKSEDSAEVFSRQGWLIWILPENFGLLVCKY